MTVVSPVEADLEPAPTAQGVAGPRFSPTAVQVSIFTVCFAVLGLVLPALVLALVGDSGRSQGWVLALVLTCWCGLRLALLIAAAQARFFAFFFWLFTYIFMGLAPAVQIRSNEPSFTTPDVLPSADTTTMWVVILGVVAFEVGTAVAVRRRSGAPRTPAPGYGSGIRPLMAVLVTFGGLAVSAYYVSRVGVGPLLTSREVANVARAEAWPALSTRAAVLSSAVYLTLIGMASLLQVWRTSRDLVVRLGLAALVAVCLADLALIVNPLSTARFSLGTVLFALVVMFGGAAGPVRIRITLTALIFGLFFLFPLANAFRTADRSFVREGFFAEYAGSADYDAFWQVANAFSAWYDTGLPVARQALGLVLFWLPRSFWADKPVDTGILLADYRGYSLTNLSAPTWAEALVNGGVVAVVIVFLVLGWAVRKVDDRVIVGRRFGGVWAVVGAALPAYFVILLRGSLLQATGSVAVMVICLLLVHRPRPKSPPPDSSAPVS